MDVERNSDVTKDLLLRLEKKGLQYSDTIHKWCFHQVSRIRGSFSTDALGLGLLWNTFFSNLHLAAGVEVDAMEILAYTVILKHDPTGEI